MNASQKSEALRLADKYEAHGFLGDHRFAQNEWCGQAATELRSQHARITDLEAQLSAIGAGGVEPLRKREASAALAVPMAEAWEQSAADTEHQRTGAGLHFNQGVAEGLRICAKDLRASLAATPAAGELATLQAGLQASVPNAPLYDPREVAFNATQAAIEDRDVERLQSLLCRMIDQLERRRKFRDGNAPGHAHGIPGIWDSDNGELAGKKCAWCEVWQEALEVHAAAKAKQGEAQQ